jgi:hypothetical protein
LALEIGTAILDGSEQDGNSPAQMSPNLVFVLRPGGKAAQLLLQVIEGKLLGDLQQQNSKKNRSLVKLVD